MKSPSVAVLQSQPTSSVDVRVEVDALTARLVDAEQRHQEARDRYRKQTGLLAEGRRANVEGALRGIEQAAALVAGVRDQLAKKKQELAAIAGVEAQVADGLRYKQELETLHQLETDERETHALLLALRAESVELARRIVLTEFRSNELLRTHAQLKQRLGV